MNPTTSPASLDQLEARLAKLEFKLGTTPSPPPSLGADVTTRLDRLTRLPRSGIAAASATGTGSISQSAASAASSSATAKQKEQSKRHALHKEFETIDRLLAELAFSPLAGPTAAFSVGGGGERITIPEAPLHFRRLEVLASAEALKRDMDLLARIRDLTMIGASSTAMTAASSSSASDRHVNCPIITSDRYNLPSDPEQIDRLERLCHRVANLHVRSGKVAKRVDNMLDCYSNVMAALSEKIVLVEEELRG
mmetsp:Transcript_6608/g.13539  ORF Transcript_6608/g.13539 Transcript_6608/m.13539 type:complete len:252 (+) Transcript_6608:108-863(+)